MSNKKNSYCDCCDDLKEHPKWLLPFYPRLTLHKMEDDSKKPEWYERKPFKRTLCWVSNINKTPTKGDIIKLIIGYQEDLKCPFRITDGYSGNYKYAVPIPTNNLLEYSLEYQMEQDK